MIHKHKIVTGDDLIIEAVLKDDGIAIVMDSSDIVAAGLVNHSGLIATGSVDLNSTNADLNNGKIAVTYTSGQTANFPVGDCTLHIKRNGLTYVLEGLEIIEGYL